MTRTIPVTSESVSRISTWPTNRTRQVIPEPYVWFVFYSMAQALQAMDIPQGTAKWVDRDLRHQVPTGDRFVLHLDIKDENSM